MFMCIYMYIVHLHKLIFTSQPNFDQFANFCGQVHLHISEGEI